MNTRVWLAPTCDVTVFRKKMIGTINISYHITDSQEALYGAKAARFRGLYNTPWGFIM